MITEYKWLADTIAFNYYNYYNLSNADLEDLKQEGYICIWEASKTFKSGKASFKNYAAIFINNRFKALIKQYKDLASTTLDNSQSYEVDYLKGIVINEADEMEALIEYEKYLKLQQVYEALDKIQVGKYKVKSDIGKYAFTLALEGLSDKEIANILKSDRSNVKKAINTTIKRVKNILNIKECC